MQVLNKEDIQKKLDKVQELLNNGDSLDTQRKINLGLNVIGLGLWGAGFAFPPLKVASYGLSIGLFIHTKYMNKKQGKLLEEMIDTTIDLSKYAHQMEFLKKLAKLIDGYYKESFKDKNFTKEEQLCQHIKLNTPNQMDLKLLGELKIQAKNIQRNHEDNHYNILVLGRSGVGKSTLINVVLDLKGENAAKENAVKPETGTDNALSPNSKETSLIEVEKKKFIPKEYGSDKSSLVLLDSRGIELSKNYSIDVASEDIQKFIEERNGLNSDPDKFIHCIWYLVSGNRFEDDEGKYIQSLKSLYTNFGLPIIFVYTRAIIEEDGDLIQKRIEEFMGGDIKFIQIIARDIKIRGKNKNRPPSIQKAFGVFEKEEGLIKISFDSARNAIKSSYFNYMKNLLKSIFVHSINMKAFFETNNYISQKINDVIYSTKPLEEVRNSFEKEFLEIFKLFLIDKEVPEFEKKNKILIKEYFNSFPNLNDPKLKDLVDKLRENEIDKLIENYRDLNEKAEKDLKAYGIEKRQEKEQIEEMLDKDIINPIKDKISYIALSYLLLKYMTLLGETLYKKLSQDFEESYKRIENQSFEVLKIVINSVYDNIMKKTGIEK